jgi:hypothetical protein
VQENGLLTSITVSDFTEDVQRYFEATGHTIKEIEQLSLEEIFLTSVQHARGVTQ